MNEEIRGLMDEIEDMRNQIDNLYYRALDLKNEFDDDSAEYSKIDAAMDSIRDAENELESAMNELYG